jgi:hypothetical protein
MSWSISFLLDAETMKASPAVTRWRELALRAPAIPIYDDYVRRRGGEVVVPSR